MILCKKDPTDPHAVWKRAEPDSPCQNICVLHPTAKLCIGCYRSADEISAWGKLSPEERTKLIGVLPKRAVLLKGRRKGRRR